MSGCIAVIENSSNELSSFEGGCTLSIYSNETGDWQLRNEISYAVSSSTSLNSIRNYIRSIVLKLADCKIVMGKNISGLAYNIFDNMGFAIFETDVLSDSMLDEIFNEVQAANNVNSSSHDIPTSPVQTETEGIYFLNLIEMHQKHPEVSSKKALKSFLDDTPFYKLELICSHVPPWLELALPSENFTCIEEELETHKFRVIITKKVCENGTCSARRSL